MPRPGDVLWPALGFVAGLNPYAGSAIRTGLTVHEALQRGRELDEEERRKREQLEQEAADKRAYSDELMGLVPLDDQSPKARYYRSVARQDPAAASKLFWTLFGEEDEEEAPLVEYEEIDETLGRIDPSVEGQFPIRTPGGQAQVWKRAPTVKDTLGAGTDWKPAAGEPGAFYRIKPKAGPWAQGEEPYEIETMMSPEIQAWNEDQPGGAAGKTGGDWMSKQLTYDKAKERLAVLKDKRKRILTEGVMAGNPQAGMMVAGPGGLDAQIQQAELAFKIAENALLKALAPPAELGPAPEVWGESPDPANYQSGALMPGQTVSSHQSAVAGATQGGGQHLYFDSQGNLIGGQ